MLRIMAFTLIYTLIWGTHDTLNFQRNNRNFDYNLCSQQFKNFFMGGGEILLLKTLNLQAQHDHLNNQSKRSILSITFTRFRTKPVMILKLQICAIWIQC